MLRAPLRYGFAARRGGALIALLLLAACAGRAGPAPALTAPPAPVWAPIPRVDGPLAIRVQYPSSNAVIAARDSTFLLGSVGHGGAALTVNGAGA
jgi:hypothetical protein